MTSRRPRFDFDAVRTALLAQAGLVRRHVEELPDAAYPLPTRLGDWTVAELVAHLQLSLGSLAAWVDAAAPGRAEHTLASYYDTGRESAALIHSLAKDAAVGASSAGLRVGFGAAIETLESAVAGMSESQVVASRMGAIGAVDIIVARCIEAVVHALDLQAAAGLPAAVADSVTAPALGVVVRAFASMLQERAPGHSVEVRIPGPAGTAFQCGEGPPHTRGTPPNVVETDAVTFVELGAGRLAWAVAVDRGVVRASGARADLALLLPVLA